MGRLNCGLVKMRAFGSAELEPRYHIAGSVGYGRISPNPARAVCWPHTNRPPLQAGQLRPH